MKTSKFFLLIILNCFLFANACLWELDDLCNDSRDMQQLLQITSFSPTTANLDDTIEIKGKNFPLTDLEKYEIIFHREVPATYFKVLNDSTLKVAVPKKPLDASLCAPIKVTYNNRCPETVNTPIDFIYNYKIVGNEFLPFENIIPICRDTQTQDIVPSTPVDVAIVELDNQVQLFLTDPSRDQILRVIETQDSFKFNTVESFSGHPQCFEIFNTFPSTNPYFHDPRSLIANGLDLFLIDQTRSGGQIRMLPVQKTSSSKIRNKAGNFNRGFDKEINKSSTCSVSFGRLTDLVFGSNGTLYTLDARSQALIKINFVADSTCNFEHEAHIFQVDSGIVETLKFLDYRPKGLTINQLNQNFFISFNRDNLIQEWDLSSPIPKNTYNVKPNQPTDIVFDSQGKIIYFIDEGESEIGYLPANNSTVVKIKHLPLADVSEPKGIDILVNTNTKQVILYIVEGEITRSKPRSSGLRRIILE